MITLADLTEFFGWASIIHIGLLGISAFLITLMRPWITSIHHKWYGVPENELHRIYFRFLANYKMFTLLFFIIPYICLKIMGN